MAQSLHPSPAQLEAFAVGNLSPADVETVAAHINDCDTCCKILLKARNDTFVDRVRNANDQTSLFNFRGDNTPLPPTPAVKRTAIIPNELANHGRYRILDLLGEGGMGVVYKAEHRLMERTVALKVINKKYTANALAVERFRREVKAAARLTHPNIVSAFDAEQAGTLHFLIMEYVDGVSLDRLVYTNGPLPIVQATRYITQAASGLHHAHQQGMVHRDIKPHNLMRTADDRIKILDFGLARITVDDTYGEMHSAQLRITSVDTVIGTPDYLSPEQARSSRDVDIRSDIYSLGCTFTFLLTGRPPFVADTPMEKLIKHCEETPTPIRQVRPEVPVEVAAVLDRMLAKRPEDRQQTPLEIVQTLAVYLRGQQTLTNAVGDTDKISAVAAVPQTPPHGKSWPLIGIVLALLLLVVGSVAGFFFLPGLLAPARVEERTADKEKTGIKDNKDLLSPLYTPARRKKVLYVLPQTELWYSDYQPIRAALEKGGVEVVTASTDTKPCQLYPDEKNVGLPVTPDVLLQNVKSTDYDGIIVCGANTDAFVSQEPGATHVKRLVTAMLGDSSGKSKDGQIVGGVCLGQRILGRHGFLTNRRVPGNDYITEDEQRGYNAIPTADETVIVNGRLILAGNDRDGARFAEVMLDAFERDE